MVRKEVGRPEEASCLGALLQEVGGSHGNLEHSLGSAHEVNQGDEAAYPVEEVKAGFGLENEESQDLLQSKTDDDSLPLDRFPLVARRPLVAKLVNMGQVREGGEAYQKPNWKTKRPKTEMARSEYLVSSGKLEPNALPKTRASRQSQPIPRRVRWGSLNQGVETAVVHTRSIGPVKIEVGIHWKAT